MKNDADGVGRMVRVDDGTPLAGDEYRIRYRRDSRSYRLGPDAFFFEEGSAHVYNRAEYGEFRAADDGSVVLVRLLDADGKPLGD
nr:GDYXXLXY domain-containing protein [Salidesulfovibrio brasiliensis]